MKQIDLRSDTVTLPTQEMLKAMTTAELGDDVYGEDKSTRKLEEYSAELLGKEAALFVPSGTMGNLVAVLTHCAKHRMPEIIAEAKSHLLMSEAGNYAQCGSISVRSVVGHHGYMLPNDIENEMRDSNNLHHPTTALICMENTHNFAGGTVSSLEQIAQVRHLADDYQIPMHLDGARLFNAAHVLNTSADNIAKYFDSVQFCLSKGLSAPVGSILVGTRSFITEARHFRKMLGGGMRQCGAIANAGMVALVTMRERLVEDHQTAFALAQDLAPLPGIAIDMDTVQSNIVGMSVEGIGITAHELVIRLKDKDVLCTAQGKYYVRFVTHRHISKDDVKQAAKEIAKVLRDVG